MCQRRVTCAILAVLAAHTTAIAGDFRVPKPSAPRVTYDWTGFYVGGHVGAGFSYRNWTLAPGATTEAGAAVLLGGQAGFNYQIGKLVTGVEADGSWGNLKDENFCPDGVNTCWTRQNWLATVTGRIGVTYDMALFYVKGGAAFTRSEHFITAQIPSPLDERGTRRRSGGTAGFGMEYALWNSWTMRLEYDYLDFGSRSVAMSNIATGQFAENSLLQQKAHEVKLGLNYLFNPGNWMPVPPPQKNSGEPTPQR